MVFDREFYDLFDDKNVLLNDIIAIIKSDTISRQTKKHTLSYLICSYKVDDVIKDKNHWSVDATKFIEMDEYNFYFKTGLIPTFEKKTLIKNLLRSSNDLTPELLKETLDAHVDYLAITHDEFRKLDRINDSAFYADPFEVLESAGIKCNHKK